MVLRDVIADSRSLALLNPQRKRGSTRSAHGDLSYTTGIVGAGQRNLRAGLQRAAVDARPSHRSAHGRRVLARRRGGRPFLHDRARFAVKATNAERLPLIEHPAQRSVVCSRQSRFALIQQGEQFKMVQRRCRKSLRALRLSGPDAGQYRQTRDADHLCLFAIVFEGLLSHTIFAAVWQRAALLTGPLAMMRILLIEDDEVIADQIRAALASLDAHFSHAASLNILDARLADGPYDLVICDRRLPDGDGLEALPDMAAMLGSTPVLILSALGRSHHRIEGLNAGADDYLSKPFSSEELLARVNALSRRAAKQAEDVMRLGALEIHVKARTVHLGGTHIALSPKEFDLLHYFAKHAGDLVSREMLLREVWGLHFDPQTNVIDVNIGRLRRKLDREGLPNPVETERGRGFRLRRVVK